MLNRSRLLRMYFLCFGSAALLVATTLIFEDQLARIVRITMFWLVAVLLAMAIILLAALMWAGAKQIANRLRQLFGNRH